jgi:hypothetical protein
MAEEDSSCKTRREEGITRHKNWSIDVTICMCCNRLEYEERTVVHIISNRLPLSACLLVWASLKVTVRHDYHEQFSCSG